MTGLIHSQKNPAVDVARGMEDILNCHRIFTTHKDGCDLCKKIRAEEDKEHEQKNAMYLCPTDLVGWDRIPRPLKSDSGARFLERLNLKEQKSLHNHCYSNDEQYRSLWERFRPGTGIQDHVKFTKEDSCALAEWVNHHDDISSRDKNLVNLIAGRALHSQKLWPHRHEDIYMGTVRLRSHEKDVDKATQCSYVRVAKLGDLTSFYVGEIQYFLDLRAAVDKDYFLVYCKWFVARETNGVFRFARYGETEREMPFAFISSIENVLMVKPERQGGASYYVVEKTRY